MGRETDNLGQAQVLTTSISLYPILAANLIGILGCSIILPFLVFLVTRLGGNALVTASIEFFGGICLILGLATRVVSVPLAFIMLVATLTSEIKKVSNLGDFLYLPEMLLLVIFVWLVFSDPGKVSLDHFLARKLGFEGKRA